VSPDLNDVTGLYLEDCRIADSIPSSSVSAVGVIPEALDVQSADRLWAISEAIVGASVRA
jgi:hypothetical protein